MVAKSCVTLCNPRDYTPPGSSVHGIFQGRILGCGLPFPLPGDLLDPGIKPTSPMSPAWAGRFFTTSATWEVSGSPKGTSGLCSLKVHQLCAFPSWLSCALLYTLCLAPSFDLNNGSLALKVGKPLSYL